MAETLRWSADGLELLDQTLLPNRVRYVRCTSADEVSNAIKSMVVRGAPAIGVAAAYGVACEAIRLVGLPDEEFRRQLSRACERLAASRPTAVNLVWAINHMRAVIRTMDHQPPPEVAQQLVIAALHLHQQDVETNRTIGKHGAGLIPRGARILTHCNAGALATAGFGTALGVIRAAWMSDSSLSVIADETRPLLQGARLTAWELLDEGIPTTLITDNMSGYLFSKGEVDVVIVGADRVAANGDVANKIGTYMVAVLAARHGVPFYVACPCSTIDMNTPMGADIVVEERNADEVTGYGDTRWAASGVLVRNPAFDVTPAALVSAIITERGVVHRPDSESMLIHMRQD